MNGEKNNDMLDSDRTGGTSSERANPPVVYSLEQIISKLEVAGIDCEPKDISLRFLEGISYHRVRVYGRALVKLRDNRKCTIKQVHDLITFDRRMSALALKYIGILETELKAQYMQKMAEKYGAFAWYDPSLYLRRKPYDRTMSSMISEVERQIAKGDGRLKTEKETYDGRIPLWDLSEYASFGSISKLYSNTADTSITGSIASFFNMRKDRLSSWLRTINDVRNICAHFNPYIIRNQIPSIPKKDPTIPVNNQSPLHLFPMLIRMFEPSDLYEAKDVNVVYSERMATELVRTLSDYLIHYPEMAPWLGSTLEMARTQEHRSLCITRP